MPLERRDLKRLDRPVHQCILDALGRFAAAPCSGVRKLDSAQWRLRVRDWRVRFSVDDENQVIVVCESCRAVGPAIADVTVGFHPGRIVAAMQPRKPKSIVNSSSGSQVHPVGTLHHSAC